MTDGGTEPAREASASDVQQAFARSYTPGALVFDEGDDGRNVYVIQAGAVELTRLGSDGRTIVARLGAGDFFGEMSAILGERRTARARALGPTRLLEIDPDTLEAMCVERPEIAIRLLRRLTSRLIEAEKRLSVLGLDDWLRPLVRAIVKRAKQDASGTARVPLRLRALADEAGLTMIEAHRALHQLLDRKVLRLIDDELIAPDLSKVAACLEPGRASSVTSPPR